MDSIAQIDAQECIEKQYSRKHIDGYIREAIEASDEMQAKVVHGVQLVQEYIAKDYYDSKNYRVAQLKHLDIHELVMTLFIGVAYCQRAELFTSITAQLASRLHFSDKKAAITTVAELIAVLCNTDAFDIQKEHRMASLTLISRIPLSPELLRFIENSQYLPPMICKPLVVENNYHSGYLTHNDSLILGSGNHHDGDLCLDVINLVNSVELQLDTAFLSNVEEVPTYELGTPEQEQGWMNFKRQSYEFYLLIATHGNRFHLTHKADKRGRLYAQGYHITTQGGAFKKAMIELAKEEYVTGVPV